MANIVWTTQKGDLGLFPSLSFVNAHIVAESTIIGVTLNYKLLNGKLPDDVNGGTLTLTSSGFITGTPQVVGTETSYTFTVRAYDNLGNISDRTFIIRINNSKSVYIKTPSGKIVTTEDSVYVDYKIDVYNPITTNVYRIDLSSGSLPDGLQMSEEGRITGYCVPPVSSVNGTPTIKNYSFSVQLISDLGVDVKTYSITVINQSIGNPPNTRVPVILNNKPLRLPVDPHDPYYGYYTDSTNSLGVIESDNYFSFKIIGHNWDDNTIIYNYSVLPPGLTGDVNTGWITGTPLIPANSISSYKFSVTVARKYIPSIKSPPETYNIIISNNMYRDVEWVTDQNLGYIDNGSKCDLYLQASSQYDLTYRIVSGSLPPNLEFSSNGQISGIVPFQVGTNQLLKAGESLSFTFTVSAYSEQFPVIYKERTFTLTVYQKNPKPLENVYFKATPNVAGRQIIKSLLEDTTLIPTEYLYRPNDNNFGKADSVKYIHAYGVESANIQTYLDAITENHYYRKLVLGELKTAIARDANGNVIYEVVYSEIIDPLVRPDGVTLPQSIMWPTKIPLNLGPWFTSISTIFTSSTSIFTSNDFGTLRRLYPGSIINMRNELLAQMNHSNNQDLLPKWMTSQQANGNTLGFTNAWVICYTLPGYSETIKNNINNDWQYKLNMIDFSVDRFIVDKSATYNYNVNLILPAWTQLPSNTPTPDPVDTYDIPVLFQQKTILPNKID